jgi:hypothetical protein
VCAREGGLFSLQSLIVTVDQFNLQWVDGVIELLHNTPIQWFQLHASRTLIEDALISLLLSRLVMLHEQRLKTISIHSICLTSEIIANICNRCQNLLQLFIRVYAQDIASLYRLVYYEL